jgi:hypothetical protein
MFYWFEPVLYLDPFSKFPETTKRPKYFVGFADNLGSILIFKILKIDYITVLHRNIVRSAADASHWKKQVTLKLDDQETLKLLYTKPNFIWKYIHYKYISRKISYYVSTRTRFKADYTDQTVGSRAWSKMENVYNLSV